MLQGGERGGDQRLARNAAGEGRGHGARGVEQRLGGAALKAVGGDRRHHVAFRRRLREGGHARRRPRRLRLLGREAARPKAGALHVRGDEGVVDRLLQLVCSLRRRVGEGAREAMM